MPQIISKEGFDRVQVKMKERQHKAAKFSARIEAYLNLLSDYVLKEVIEQ